MEHTKIYDKGVKSQEWIVFLPIKEDNAIDVENPLFGIYDDEEYERIAPFDKVKNYETTLPFSNMKDAKDFVDLVRNEKTKCKHENTYVAVRHESGLKLVKCRDCGAKV